MDEKILFIYSERLKINLPEVLFKEYQIKTVTLKNGIHSTILDFRPQLIVVDEYIPFNIIKKITVRFKFIPLCVIGNFEISKKLERLLELGVSTINLAQSEEEIKSTIKNILWFSLSKEELWSEEYKISVSELKKERFLVVARILLNIAIITLLTIAIPRFSSLLSSFNKLEYQVDIGYINASDISVVRNNYLLSDWTLKNIFEYEQESDKLVKMYVLQEQANTISFNDAYAITYSMFNNKINLYKYPDFEVVVSTSLFNNVAVLSIYIDNENITYIADNKSNIYEYKLINDKLVYVKSFKVENLLPIDVVADGEYIYLLDNNNNLHKYRKFQYVKEETIILENYFPTNQCKFTSFGISKKWLYLISENDRKVIKLTKKILKV
ncbi:MAG: hypothetical protein N2643_00665 [Endomicrobia bacterium]|nr:hypothetical protein [Endomicrobiia bacterium]